MCPQLKLFTASRCSWDTPDPGASEALPVPPAHHCPPLLLRNARQLLPSVFVPAAPSAGQPPMSEDTLQVPEGPVLSPPSLRTGLLGPDSSPHCHTTLAAHHGLWPSHI